MKPAIYSLYWSLDRVHELEKKYARATDFVKKILSITDRDCALFLATGDEVWNGYRDLVHRTDKWLEIRGPKANYYTFVEYMAEHITHFIHLPSQKRLTGRIQQTIIEEQVSKGGNERLLADRYLPFIPAFDSEVVYGDGSAI